MCARTCCVVFNSEKTVALTPFASTFFTFFLLFTVALVRFAVPACMRCVCVCVVRLTVTAVCSIIVTLSWPGCVSVSAAVLLIRYSSPYSSDLFSFASSLTRLSPPFVTFALLLRFVASSMLSMTHVLFLACCCRSCVRSVHMSFVPLSICATIKSAVPSFVHAVRRVMLWRAGVHAVRSWR